MPKYYPNTTTTYYPFGMLMPGRTYSSEAYNWGFNGMQKDDEISGEGNNLDFGARIYDSRLGRWMSVDPLSNELISFSPYHGFYNSPVFIIDPNGEKGVPNHLRRAYKFAKKHGGNIYISTSGEVAVLYNGFRKINDSKDGGQASHETNVLAKKYKSNIYDKVIDFLGRADDIVDLYKGNEEFRFGVIIETKKGDDVFENPDASKLKFDGSYFTMDYGLMEGLFDLAGTKRNKYFNDAKNKYEKNEKLTENRNTKNSESESLKNKLDETGIKSGQNSSVSKDTNMYYINTIIKDSNDNVKSSKIEFDNKYGKDTTIEKREK